MDKQTIPQKLLVSALDEEQLYSETETEKWVIFFYTRAQVDQIFKFTKESLYFGTPYSANVIGSKWLQFSEMMPKILCSLASKVDSNLARMRIIKIAWEELGEGDSEHIHPRTFKDCLKSIQAKISDTKSKAIDELEEYSQGSFLSNAEIFGFALGLEIVAIENIQTLLDGLSKDQTSRETLKNSEFFKVHFKNEESHIRHCVTSFIKYCKEEKQQLEFIYGFDNGVRFWTVFWNEIASEMELSFLADNKKKNNL